MDGVEGGVLAGEHGGGVVAAAGLEEEVLLAAVGRGGGDFGGGGETAAAVAGDGGGFGVEGEGPGDGAVEMHGGRNWSAKTDGVGGLYMVGRRWRSGSVRWYDV